MRNYVMKRLLQLIPILFVITFLSFGMMRLAGSDAVLQKMENTGMVMSQDVIEQAQKELGLDKPFLVQYVVWLKNLLHGDMGVSYISGEDIFDTFLAKLPATLLLTVVSIGLTIVFHPAWRACGGKTESDDRLPDSVLQLYGKQHAQFFRGTAFDADLCDSPEVVSGYFGRSQSAKRGTACTDPCDCHVCQVSAAGKGNRSG